MNRNGTTMVLVTKAPPSRAGSKRHFRTAAVAARSKSPPPEWVTATSPTLPSLSTVTESSTRASRRSASAFAGYTASTELTTRGGEVLGLGSTRGGGCCARAAGAQNKQPQSQATQHSSKERLGFQPQALTLFEQHPARPQRGTVGLVCSDVSWVSMGFHMTEQLLVQVNCKSKSNIQRAGAVVIGKRH